MRLRASRADVRWSRVAVLIVVLREREIRERHRQPWADFQDVLAAAGVTYSDSLARDLVAAVSQAVHTGDIVAILNRHGGLGDRGMHTIRASEQRLASDADVYALALRRRSEQEGRSGQPVLNFHAPVGAVQTGAGAVANVVQQIGTS